jgi:hypothetical protein
MVAEFSPAQRIVLGKLKPISWTLLYGPYKRTARLLKGGFLEENPKRVNHFRLTGKGRHCKRVIVNSELKSAPQLPPGSKIAIARALWFSIEVLGGRKPEDVLVRGAHSKMLHKLKRAEKALQKAKFIYP